MKDYGDHIGVTYGFTSIVDQDHLRHYGEDNSDIKIRFHSVIKTDQDKIAVASEIKRVYDANKNKIIISSQRQLFLNAICKRAKELNCEYKNRRYTEEDMQNILKGDAKQCLKV